MIAPTTRQSCDSTCLKDSCMQKNNARIHTDHMTCIWISREQNTPWNKHGQGKSMFRHNNSTQHYYEQTWHAYVFPGSKAHLGIHMLLTTSTAFPSMDGKKLFMCAFSFILHLHCTPVWKLWATCDIADWHASRITICSCCAQVTKLYETYTRHEHILNT